MKEPIKLTDEQKTEMVSLYAQGTSTKECAQKFNVDAWTVHRWVKAAGVQSVQ